MAGGWAKVRWTDEETEKLRRLFEMDFTYEAISRTMGRSVATISDHLRRMGLSRRERRTMVQPRPASVQARPAPEADLEEPVDTSLGGRLRDTKGRYAALAEIAEAQGWTQVQVQQRYHRAMRGEAV